MKKTNAMLNEETMNNVCGGVKKNNGLRFLDDCFKELKKKKDATENKSFGGASSEW